MAWQKRGERKGKRRLPETQRQRILRRNPICWFKYPGLCTIHSTVVHHILDAEDGGSDTDDNLTGACRPCHDHHSAQTSQKRAVQAAWDWKRKPERHPGLLD